MVDIEGTNGQRTEFKAVGRENIPGRLSYSIATGMAKFGGDCVVSDMLHAKFLRSPFGPVNIKSMNITATHFGRPPETTYHKGSHILDTVNTSFCEMAVDTKTGETEVPKYVVLCDPARYGATGISHCLADPLLPVCAEANAIGKMG